MIKHNVLQMITLFHQDFCHVAKLVIIAEFFFCTKNQVSAKYFMQQFFNLIGSKFELQIKWITRKAQCLHPACKICHGVYKCGETYMGETVGNVETR